MLVSSIPSANTLGPFEFCFAIYGCSGALGGVGRDANSALAPLLFLYFLTVPWGLYLVWCVGAFLLHFSI